MVKRINVTLPEELLLKADIWGKQHFQDRSEVIKNALVKLITDLPSEDEIPDEASEKTVSKVPVLEVPTQPELPPFCEATKFCRSRSTGRFKIITNDGTNELVRYLCPTHLGLAKREGEVREI